MKHSSRQFGLVVKVKNLVVLAPVLGAISRPAMAKIKLCNYNRLCSKMSLFTNVFMKRSVLIFRRRQTLQRKLYC